MKRYIKKPERGKIKNRFNGCKWALTYPSLFISDRGNKK